MQKEIKFAYIAGLFDGEGTVTLTYNNKKDTFRTPTISMSSTSIELLEFLTSEFGGSIVRQKIYKEHHKQSWSWKLQRRKAIIFLNCILPYMKEKSKIFRAKLLCNDYIKLTPRNGKYSEEAKSAKLEFEKKFFAS